MKKYAKCGFHLSSFGDLPFGRFKNAVSITCARLRMPLRPPRHITKRSRSWLLESIRYIQYGTSSILSQPRSLNSRVAPLCTESCSHNWNSPAIAAVIGIRSNRRDEETRNYLLVELLEIELS